MQLNIIKQEIKHRFVHVAYLHLCSSPLFVNIIVTFLVCILVRFVLSFQYFSL